MVLIDAKNDWDVDPDKPCPYCGSSDLIRIVIGTTSGSAIRSMENSEKVEYRGCVGGPWAANWKCSKCEREFTNLKKYDLKEMENCLEELESFESELSEQKERLIEDAKKKNDGKIPLITGEINYVDGDNFKYSDGEWINLRESRGELPDWMKKNFNYIDGEWVKVEEENTDEESTYPDPHIHRGEKSNETNKEDNVRFFDVLSHNHGQFKNDMSWVKTSENLGHTHYYRYDISGFNEILAKWRTVKRKIDELKKKLDRRK